MQDETDPGAYTHTRSLNCFARLNKLEGDKESERAHGVFWYKGGGGGGGSFTSERRASNV